jgi:protein-disulfide isomerase
MEQDSPNKLLVPLAIVVAGGLVAGAIYFGGSNQLTTNPPTGSGQANAKIDIAPVTEKDHIIGSRDADLVIVEYSDTECPFCKSFHSTMKEVVRTYDGKVSWVYRHFPIAQLHTRAAKEAEATECAAELGGNQGFWAYTNRIFEITNSNDSLDPSELSKVATYAGLNEAIFNACLSSGKYSEFVKKARAAHLIL